MSNKEGQISSIDQNIQMTENSGRFIQEDDIVVNLADTMVNLAEIIRQFELEGIPMRDVFGNSAIFGTFGDQMVSERKDQIASVYCYDFRPVETDSLLPAGFTVGIIDSNLTLANTLAGAGYVESLTAIRYRAAQMIYAYGTAQFRTGMPIGTYFYGFGIYDNEDGYSIGVKDGAFGVRHKRTDRTNRLAPVLDWDRFTPNNEFNVDKLDGTGPSGYNLFEKVDELGDPDENGTERYKNGNVFGIFFGYLGYAPIIFAIKTVDRWQPFHIINYPGTSQKTSVSIPYLPLRLEIDDPNGLGFDLRIGSIAGGTLGGDGVDPQTRPQAFVLPISVAISGPTTIVSFRQPQSYKDIKNKIGSLLKIVSAVSDGAQGFTVRLEFNPDVITPGTWAAVADDGPVEYSLDTVLDIGTGEESGIVVTLAKLQSKDVDVAKIVESRLRRGQVAHFYGDGANGTLETFAISYNDEF